MMILAWNEDYGQTAQTTPASKSATATIEEATQQSFAENNADGFSVPEDKSTISSAQNNTAPETQLVHVKTDVLDIIIDLKGGNIVSATMPNYKTRLGSDEPLSLLDTDNLYYVVESGLFGKNGFDSAKNGPMPTYQAEKPEYILGAQDDSLQLDLYYQDQSGVKVTKRYQFKRDTYLINVSYIIENKSQKNWEANFSGKIVRDQSPDPSVQTSMGLQSFLGMALSSPEKPYEKYDFSDLKESPINEEIQGGWVAFIQHYLLIELPKVKKHI